MFAPTSKVNMMNKMKVKQNVVANNKIPPPPEAPQTLEQKLFKNQIVKTQLCRYYAAGICNVGKACAFAHGDGDLKAPPDLSKTRICRAWLAGKCDKSRDECKFAHGRKDVNTGPFFNLRLPESKIQNKAQKSSPCLVTPEVAVKPLKGLPMTIITPKQDMDFNDTLSTCSGIDQISSSPPSEADESSDCHEPETPPQSPQAKFVPLLSPVQQWLKYMTVFLATAPKHEKAKLVTELRNSVPDQYYD